MANQEKPTSGTPTPRGPVGTSELIISAVESEFRARRDKGIAQLSVYVNSHVGVPDHPGIVDDCVAIVEQIAAAEEGLRVLKNILAPAPSK